jgi:hypothetical protein
MADAFRRWPGVEGFDLLLDRHICANMPSICRSPLRIFCVSFDAMLSKARERSASILGICSDDYRRIVVVAPVTVAIICCDYGWMPLRFGEDKSFETMLMSAKHSD